MQLFYIAELKESSTDIAFDKIESRHIIKSLRKKEGDLIYITNGENLLFKGEITAANEKKCQVHILSVTQKKSNRKYKLQLAIAPTKSNDRFEWFLEKATEIGIDTIFPIISTHSERKVIKKDRLNKVLLSAMKQSLQYQLPVLHDLHSFKEFISHDFEGQKFIAHCEKTDKKALKSLLQANTNITILIGPEGDFSTDEIALALQNGFIPVSLGATRLRTETAGIVAAHSVAFVNE